MIQEEKTKARVDFNEITDENGRVWYEIEQREESRKLKPGDVIKYYRRIGTLEENGIMVVGGFNSKSDFTVKSYIVRFTLTEKETGYKRTFAASDWEIEMDETTKFSFATEDEIKDFFECLKKRDYKHFYLNSKWRNVDYFKLLFCDEENIPDFIKNAKYIENLYDTITELYRIVEGALKDDSNMIMRYAKRLIDRFAEDKTVNIDWNETEKGVREILNKYSHRPAKIATLDDNKYYCHFNETEINPKECETCGARDCCEHNLEKMEDEI